LDPQTDSVLALCSALLLAVPLVIGTWRVGDTEAPIRIWPLGPIVAIILVLELVIAVA
jgi:hypothetical protein